MFDNYVASSSSSTTVLPDRDFFRFFDEVIVCATKVHYKIVWYLHRYVNVICLCSKNLCYEIPMYFPQLCSAKASTNPLGRKVGTQLIETTTNTDQMT